MRMLLCTILKKNWPWPVFHAHHLRTFFQSKQYRVGLLRLSGCAVFDPTACNWICPRSLRNYLRKQSAKKTLQNTWALYKLRANGRCERSPWERNGSGPMRMNLYLYACTWLPQISPSKMRSTGYYTCLHVHDSYRPRTEVLIERPSLFAEVRAGICQSGYADFNLRGLFSVMFN